MIGSTTFMTTFIFPSTTLSFSFFVRYVTSQFTRGISTKITTAREYSHLATNSNKATVDLPDPTTLIETLGHTDIIVSLPKIPTEVIFTDEIFELIFGTYEPLEDDGKTGGANTLATWPSAESDCCVLSFSTTIILPTVATQPIVALHADGLTTSFLLPSIDLSLVSVKDHIFLSLCTVFFFF